MSFVKLPYPDMVTNDALDPERVNANFRALAQVINGRLGVENLKRASFNLGDFECSRTSVSLYLPLTYMVSGVRRWPVFMAPVAMTLLGVGVSGAVPGETGVIGAKLWREIAGPDELLAELEPPCPGASSFWVTRLHHATIPALNTLWVDSLDVGASIEGITLELRADSQ